MFGTEPLETTIEIGDYVQNTRVPEALGIVVDIDPVSRKATVDWDIPGMEEGTVTTTFLSSLRLIMKPHEC